MARIDLLGGAYAAPSIIAAAQRSINLYPEINPKDAQSPAPVTHYPRPGLTLLQVSPSPGRGRCAYRASNGDLYVVVDNVVYYVDPDWAYHTVGNLVTLASTPVYMADNGTNILLVDGTTQGYTINMTTRVIVQIGDPNFIGANRADYFDTFLVMNQPATPNWYATLSNSVAFNALDFGTKTGYPDNITALIVLHRQVWLLGPQKGEVWYNAGATPFAFSSMPQTLIEQGIVAPYSLSKQDVSCYWLAQSPEGDRMVMKGDQNLAAQRISTHAIEKEFKSYKVVADAIGACYQTEGHGFYKLHFPTSDTTWVWDEASKLWHQRASCDINGVLHRERDAFNAFAYGVNVGLDWSNGSLYALDVGQFVDQIVPSQLSASGVPIVQPIVCIRTMPHLVGQSFERIGYDALIADVEVGAAVGIGEVPLTTSPWASGFSSGFGPLGESIFPPRISLRISTTRGASWSSPIMRSLGGQGAYYTTPMWWNLGYARDMVFELSWSSAVKSALQSVYALFQPFEGDNMSGQGQ